MAAVAFLSTPFPRAGHRATLPLFESQLGKDLGGREEGETGPALGRRLDLARGRTVVEPGLGNLAGQERSAAAVMTQPEQDAASSPAL